MTAPSLDGWKVLQVDGEIDIARLDELEDLVLAECSGDCSDTVVDLSNVEFIDTTGVAWLLRSRDLFLDRGRRFALVVPESLDRIFELTGLTNAFEMYRSLHQHVNADRAPESPLAAGL